jgi:glycosyltransferase involved in cell wall biosynthesis
VQPHVDDDRVVFLGSVGPTQRAQVLGAAAVLLHPIAFDEPFGLSVVEAMVCGTPVVAYRRGSMPEVIDVAVTGYLADDVESAVGAVDAAARLDRGHVAARARERFSAQRMVSDYLRVYERLLSR